MLLEIAGQNTDFSFGLSCFLMLLSVESILSENTCVFLTKVCDTVVELCCYSDLNSMDI